MEYNVKGISRISFCIGLVLLFISLFLEWYVLQTFDRFNQLVASWKYNIFFEWYPDFLHESLGNTIFRPKNLSIPLIFNVIYIGAILISGYAVIVKDIELSERPNIVTYIHIFLLVMVIFYCFIFPIAFLLPNQLYFPFVDYENTFTHLYYYQGIGMGYILQLISLVLIFPYTVFHIRTMLTFEKKKETADNSVRAIITSIQEPIDYDKLIAEEELKLKRKRL